MCPLLTGLVSSLIFTYVVPEVFCLLLFCGFFLIVLVIEIYFIWILVWKISGVFSSPVLCKFPVTCLVEISWPVSVNGELWRCIWKYLRSRILRFLGSLKIWLFFILLGRFIYFLSVFGNSGWFHLGIIYPVSYLSICFTPHPSQMKAWHHVVDSRVFRLTTLRMDNAMVPGHWIPILYGNIALMWLPSGMGHYSSARPSYAQIPCVIETKWNRTVGGSLHRSYAWTLNPRSATRSRVIAVAIYGAC